MGAINAMSVQRSEAQLRSKQPRTETTDPPATTIPSTSAPSSLSGGVTLKAIMVQLQYMDAHLDTLSDDLCQANTHVSRIARRQARLDGFTASPSPSPKASTNKDSDNDADDDNENEDASSSNDEEMTTSQ